MKKLLALSVFLFSFSSYAQPNTEVYLMEINSADGKIKLTNLRNISNNEGYDNQPSFYDEKTILFASTRNGQTDIANYDVESGSVTWISNTPGGGEYSPLRIPNSTAISAVRLDTTGLQRLYQYNSENGTSKAIRKDAKVGYHVWYSEDILVNTILIENRMDLVLSKFSADVHVTVAKNVGRSLHKIPGSELISFISKNDGATGIFTLNPNTGETAPLMGLPKDVDDITWLPSGLLLFPNGNSIMSFNPKLEDKPSTFHSFQEEEINSISRMAVSPDGKYLALVSQEPPSKIVQKQVESFNAENLDAFAACYSENVVVQNFPNDTISTGNKSLIDGYKRYFENNPKTTVEVVKRIQIGKVVIDEELVERSGRTNRQAAIYEVTNGYIASMTFIHEKEVISKASTIIDENLEAYRARDIEAFLDSYSDNVEVYMFPNKLSYTGKEKMRLQYPDFFKGAKSLTCEIKNRMVLGNIIIDEEFLTINDNHHTAVAIYEINDDKISKVTFIQ